MKISGRFFLLITAIMLPGVLTGQSSHNLPTLGWMAGGSTSTVQLNASSKWAAFSFVLPATKTLDEVRVYISAVAGTPGTHMAASLFSDSSGVPGTAIDGPRTVGSSLSAGAAFDFTGFAASCMGGTQYWIVFQNTDGAPASNNMTIRFGSGAAQFGGGANVKNGWNKVESADSGGAWATAVVSQVTGIRLKFSDGTYDGLPNTNIGSTGAGTAVYSSRESGVMITAPSGPTIHVTAITMLVATSGAPTGSFRYRIYSGTGASPTLLGTTYSAAPSNLSVGTQWVRLFFPTPIPIPGGTMVRIVGSETTQADGSGSAYTSQLWTIDNDANSKALMPFGVKATFSVDNGGSFTETDTQAMPFALILAPTPFTVSGGTGGGSGGQRVYGSVR